MDKTIYVCGFMFTSDEEYVWLIKKLRPDWQRGRLNGVGGHVEEGESPINAMRREFQEEAGLALLHWELFCIVTGYDYEVHFYRTNSDATPISQTDEELVEIPTAKVTQWVIIENLSWLIPMARDFNRPFWPYRVWETNMVEPFGVVELTTEEQDTTIDLLKEIRDLLAAQTPITIYPSYPAPTFPVYPYPSYPDLPIYPTYGQPNTCSRCGLPLSETMGYVCGNSPCPAGLGGYTTIGTDTTSEPTSTTETS